MKYRKLGKTNMKVSILGFGAMKLPEISFKEADNTLNRALDLGINFIDTARGYGDSERKIGCALKRRRDEFYIATKTTERDVSVARKDLETSLKELGMERVDLYQLHTVSDEATYNRVMGKGGALEYLKKAKDEGKISHIGISVHRDLKVMEKAIVSREFESIILAYSPLDQENVGNKILPLAKKHDLGVIVMKSLSGGQLCGIAPAKENYDPVVRASLRFVLSNENISTVISGMRSVKEVEENITSAEIKEKLSEEEKQWLFRAIAGKKYRYGQMCLRCGYCLPCRQGINIPEVLSILDIFRAYPEELKHIGIERYKSLEVKPDQCIECKQCEEKCVAKLPIREMLKETQGLVSRLCLSLSVP